MRSPGASIAAAFARAAIATPAPARRLDWYVAASTVVAESKSDIRVCVPLVLIAKFLYSRAILRSSARFAGPGDWTER